MGSWTRRITPRPGALIRDRDSVEENADVEIAQFYLMISSIRIFNLFSLLYYNPSNKEKSY